MRAVSDEALRELNLGKKWYAWSGPFRLVIHTDGGPVYASRFLMLRVPWRRLNELEQFVYCSQAGFIFDGRSFWEHSRKAAARAGVFLKLLDAIPYAPPQS
jgi:hypothetical protein